jgi:hypothetical protein
MVGSLPAVSGPPPPGEVTAVHSRLQKLALGIEETRQYLDHLDPAMPIAERPLAAFEQRWFGNKSFERVSFLVATLVERYDAFPEALSVLRRWRPMDSQTRQVICHWHLQLADPLYRRFSGRFLVDRRSSPGATLDRPIVLRWLRNEFPGKWSDSTCVQFASKLLSAASEAGLVSPKRDPRALLLPKVPDVALAYLLHLLRTVRFEGTLTENPYLASVGLLDGYLDQRLRALSSLSFRRMGDVTDVEWSHHTLTSWADATL